MGNQTILIVDDEPDFVTMLKQNFQSEGYIVEVAYNGVGLKTMISMRIFQLLYSLRFQTMSAQHSIPIPRRWIWRQMIFCSNRHPSRISWKVSDHC